MYDLLVVTSHVTKGSQIKIGHASINDWGKFELRKEEHKTFYPKAMHIETWLVNISWKNYCSCFYKLYLPKRSELAQDDILMEFGSAFTRRSLEVHVGNSR